MKNKCRICGTDIGKSRIYLKLPKGKLVGPLCDDCINRNTEYKEAANNPNAADSK